MDRLLRDVDLVGTAGDLSAVDVTAVECDSRAVTPGALFCCVAGRLHDGHDFAGAAAEAGAAGLLTERVLPVSVAQGVVEPGAMRAVMAEVACAFHRDPSSSLRVVGVTGTNGKTTVSHLVAAIFEAHGEPCRVIGTLSGARTTPESPVLQRLLADARDSGQAAVSMEVSSHALVEHRVDAVHFAAGVFTNLGHDHLDYHQTMERYFEAKATLFEPGRCALGVVNADDPWGARLLERGSVPMVAFRSSELSDVELSPRGSSFTWRGRRVALALPGAFHVTNALAAATTAAALGVPESTVVDGLESAAPVPGRFEVVPGDAPFTVVVDYAHTPDA
ncbi:MAG TPA: UDP-N-acetylmuramoyl-L-alanyl-D-glutamate--2,6-diaminopimelate ligase, partial [Acidimicrobiales bacterium]|nr:UDP-N-acetylmuramoyl-L-alanyl-D-glutamate--2,6-diaminopimelate ligase [Acidimicrobiales bacterium]